MKRERRDDRARASGRGWRGWKVEALDEVAEGVQELRIVAVGVLVDESDHLPVAVCRLLVVAARLGEAATWSRAFA